MVNSNSSAILGEIKHFVFRHQPLSGDEAIFGELFNKIALSKGLNAGTPRKRREHLPFADFNNSQKEYLKKLRTMLSWDILNFLIDWIKEENLSEESQKVIVSIFSGSGVMDEEDLSELAEMLKANGLNNFIRTWLEEEQLAGKP